jgi:eukaryotic-like serine/threonine-protein kinase
MYSDQILRNRYKIIRPLGSGNFGTTYLAEDLDLPNHPLCVVKNLRQSQDPIDLEIIIGLFDKEAEALYRLGNEHNQIPKLFAHFQENGEFFLVQEYIDGHDLSKEIFSGSKLSEAKVIQLLKDVLEVLTVIHNKNIIHRDIKPHNLMRRNSDGKIVLIDFGTVKEISGLTINPQGETEASIMIGTNGYMPSEQSQGYPKLCSDVYAVGMLGIYALTGVRPQELPKDVNTLEVIWEDMASVSPFLANVLNKMVRYNFNERYPTASQALEALTTSESTSTSSPSLPSLSSILLSALATLSALGANQRLLIVIGTAFLVGIGLLSTAVFISIVSNPLVIPDSEQTTSDAEICPGIDEFSKLSIPNQPPDWEEIKSGAKYYGIPEDTRTGKGTVVLKSGNIYYGDVENATFTGCGKLQYDGNTYYYIGQFRKGNYEGRGKLIYANGNQYDGEFKTNQLHGQGICRFKDGSSLSGDWENNKHKETGRYCN